MRGELQAKLKKVRVVKKRETAIFIDITSSKTHNLYMLKIERITSAEYPLWTGSESNASKNLTLSIQGAVDQGVCL